jgi:peptidoglycan/xylan/chitin deacetylase (PgdA/CDA1 family)
MSVSRSLSRHLAPHRQLPVLMYHSLTASRSRSDALSVPVGLLATHLAILAENGFRVVGLTQALAVLTREPEARLVAVTFDDGYADFLLCLDLLERFDARVTLYLPTALIGGNARVHAAATRLLTWDEVRALPTDRVELGSHAATHIPLDIQPSPALDEELFTSRRALTEETGRAPRSLAYPHGYASDAVVRAVRDAGYSNACIVGRRLYRPTDDPYSIPRLQVTPDATPDAFLRLLDCGEPGIRPVATRVLAGSWRWVRRGAYRRGKVLT